MAVDDNAWMDFALEEARKGVGLTSPNPPVGAVIVRGDQELGRGYHRKAGELHAEREAMEAAFKAGFEDLRGATIFVTLEPCSTVGKTGACTEAIVREGITTVVYGATDPNPHHSGRAGEFLRERGIVVRTGVRKKECECLIRAFAKVQRTGLPWVTVKTAMTLDGSITRPQGEGSWLSNETSRQDVQKLRETVDAIMTTGKTVRRDNPQLTLRSPDVPKEKDQPWRVVITTNEQNIPKDSHVLRDAHASKTVIATESSLPVTLSQLADKKKVMSILVEAGGAFVGTLFDEDLVDELVVYLAPLVGSGSTPSVGGAGVQTLAERFRLSQVSYKKIGSDVRMSGLVSGRGGDLER